MITLALGFALATTSPAPAPTPQPAPATAPAAAALVVDGAWIRQPPPGAKMLGGYVRLKNPSSSVVKVVSAATSLSPRAELHTHLRVDGMMKMRQVPFIEIAAGGEVVLAPGGLHLMVMQLPSTPNEGAAVDVTLILDDGRTVAFKAPVLKEAPKSSSSPPPPPPAPAPSGW